MIFWKYLCQSPQKLRWSLCKSWSDHYRWGEIGVLATERTVKISVLFLSDIKWWQIKYSVLFHIGYASSAYNSVLNSSLNRKLQVLQSLWLKHSYCINRLQHVTPQYNMQNILRLNCRSTLHLEKKLRNLLYEFFVFCVYSFIFSKYVYICIDWKKWY